MPRHDEEPRAQRPGSSGDWARRLRRGDPEAVRHVRDRVRRILSARRLGFSPDERDDLEQEIMTDVWRAVNRSGFDFSGGFWGFVEVVSSRRCIDSRRRQREIMPLVAEYEDGSEGPFERVVNRQRTRLASEILDRLDQPCRELVTMRLKDGMSYAEMSKAMGRSEGALRVQMHRCIGRARDIAATLTDTAESEGEEGGRGGAS